MKGCQAPDVAVETGVYAGDDEPRSKITGEQFRGAAAGQGGMPPAFTGASTGGDYDLLSVRYFFAAVRCTVLPVFVDKSLLLFFCAAAGVSCHAFR